MLLSSRVTRAQVRHSCNCVVEAGALLGEHPRNGGGGGSSNVPFDHAAGHARWTTAESWPGHSAQRLAPF